MANLGGTFDATQVAPSEGRDALTPGKYPMQIISSERKPIGSSGEGGDKLELCWQVTSGPGENRLVWQDLLLWYNVPGPKGDQTREIAQRDFSAICHATGKLNISDSEELHFIPCSVSIGYERRKDRATGQRTTNQSRNEVKSVSRADGAVGNTATVNQAPFPSAPPATAGAAPSGGGWARRAG